MKKLVFVALIVALSIVKTSMCDVVCLANEDTSADVKVEVDGKLLVKDKDYILEWEDNIQPGTGKVRIKFIGNYTGVRVEEFDIIKPSSPPSSGGHHRPKATPTPTPEVPKVTEKPEPELPIESPTPNKNRPHWDSETAYIRGYEDGTFRPNSYITRAETAVMLNRILKPEPNEYVKPIDFPDVGTDSWYSRAIEQMTSSGNIKGYDDGTFKPSNSITREELLAILLRGSTELRVYEELPFKDISGLEWGVDYIYTAYKIGLIDGYKDGTFRPNNCITRAEVVKIVNQYIERSERISTNPFSDVDNSHWAYREVLKAAYGKEVPKD